MEINSSQLIISNCWREVGCGLVGCCFEEAVFNRRKSWRAHGLVRGMGEMKYARRVGGEYRENVPDPTARTYPFF